MVTRLLALLCLLGGLAACAGASETAIAQQAALGDAGVGHPDDPYEATNRDLLESNLWTYDTFVEPTVEGYRSVLPQAARRSVSHFFDNLSSPRILVNDLLQGEWERAAETATRFVFNTTIGFGGLFDRASQMGIPRHDEDFGQTLAVHGVESGPYLVVPLFGPTTPRDLSGQFVDLALDPGNWLLFPVSFAANFTGSNLDRFARNPEFLNGTRASSVDFYATLRDGWLQNRRFEIANGQLPQEDDPWGSEFSDALEESLEEASLRPEAGAAAFAFQGSGGPER